MRFSDDEFGQLVQQALESLPTKFRRKMENLAVEVQSRPTPAMARSLGCRSVRDLLGAYIGVPLTHKHVDTPWEFPEFIYIFQRNIEDICATPQEVVEEVRRTVLHEIAHHFGWDDDALDEMGY